MGRGQFGEGGAALRPGGLRPRVLQPRSGRARVARPPRIAGGWARSKLTAANCAPAIAARCLGRDCELRHASARGARPAAAPAKRALICRSTSAHSLSRPGCAARATTNCACAAIRHEAGSVFGGKSSPQDSFSLGGPRWLVGEDQLGLGQGSRALGVARRALGAARRRKTGWPRRQAQPSAAARRPTSQSLAPARRQRRMAAGHVASGVKRPRTVRSRRRGRPATSASVPSHIRAWLADSAAGQIDTCSCKQLRIQARLPARFLGDLGGVPGGEQVGRRRLGVRREALGQDPQPIGRRRMPAAVLLDECGLVGQFESRRQIARGSRAAGRGLVVRGDGRLEVLLHEQAFGLAAEQLEIPRSAAAGQRGDQQLIGPPAPVGTIILVQRCRRLGGLVLIGSSIAGHSLEPANAKQRFERGEIQVG